MGTVGVMAAAAAVVATAVVTAVAAAVEEKVVVTAADQRGAVWETAPTARTVGRERHAVRDVRPLNRKVVHVRRPLGHRMPLREVSQQRWRRQVELVIGEDCRDAYRGFTRGARAHGASGGGGGMEKEAMEAAVAGSVEAAMEMVADMAEV